MMMSLGLFVFELASLPYQEVARDTDWRHARTSRIGALPANQFLGPGEDTLNIGGNLLPDIAGDVSSLDLLRQMAADGEAWPLVDGLGNVHGAWVIDRIGDRRSNFFADGVAREIDFNIALHRVEDAAQVLATEDAEG